MSLKDRINDDMKAAMRARDTDRLGAIRLLNAAIKQKEVDERVTRTYPADTMGLGVWFTFSDSFRSVAAGNWIVLSLEWWTASHRYEAKVIYQPESGAPRYRRRRWASSTKTSGVTCAP